MAKKRYGIAVDYPDGVTGWLTDSNSKAALFDSAEDAEKAMKRALKDTRYTWTLPIDVRTYKEVHLDEQEEV